MENKLGLYISNLMTTIVDKEEKLFVRKLAFNELENISKDISSFLTSYISEIKPDPFQEEQNKNRNKKQTEINFGVKHENR
jgi:3-methyladenine DNA glycosylase AlkC